MFARQLQIQVKLAKICLNSIGQESLMLLSETKLTKRLLLIDQLLLVLHHHVPGSFQMILKMLELEPIMNILKSYKKLIGSWTRILFMWLVIIILHPGAATDIVVTNSILLPALKEVTKNVLFLTHLDFIRLNYSTL